MPTIWLDHMANSSFYSACLIVSPISYPLFNDKVHGCHGALFKAHAIVPEPVYSEN